MFSLSIYSQLLTSDLGCNLPPATCTPDQSAMHLHSRVLFRHGKRHCGLVDTFSLTSRAKGTRITPCTGSCAALFDDKPLCCNGQTRHVVFCGVVSHTCNIMTICLFKQDLWPESRRSFCCVSFHVCASVSAAAIFYVSQHEANATFR